MTLNCQKIQVNKKTNNKNKIKQVNGKWAGKWKKVYIFNYTTHNQISDILGTSDVEKVEEEINLASFIISVTQVHGN